MWVAINGQREWGKPVSTPPPVATPPGASSGRKRGSFLFTTLQSVEGRPFSSTPSPSDRSGCGCRWDRLRVFNTQLVELFARIEDSLSHTNLPPFSHPPTHTLWGPRAAGREPRGETMGTLGESSPSLLWFCFRAKSTIDCCWRSILHRVPQGDLEEPPLFVPLKFPPVLITCTRMVSLCRSPLVVPRGGGIHCHQLGDWRLKGTSGELQ